MAEILPAIFFGHGNPMNAVLDNNYTKAWSRIGQTTPKPKAILSISAHWFVSETVDAGSEQELRNHVLVILRCLCRSQRCGSEIHAESFAPNGHCAVFRQVQVAGERVVLVADVAFDHSQVNETGPLHGRYVLGIVGGDHVDVNIRAV
jgi:hypothetical protein